MLTILKDTTKLEIKNVICFYVGFNTKISTAEELKSKKEEDWSYQDYLVDSCAKHKYNLVWFNKATVNYTLIDGVINIDDEITDNHISLTKEENDIFDDYTHQFNSSDGKLMQKRGMRSIASSVNTMSSSL